MEDKKYIQIITSKDTWSRWNEIAKSHGMPLVTFIKHLMAREYGEYFNRG